MTDWKQRFKGERTCTDAREKRKDGEERRILTPIDKTVIVLVVSSCAISFLLEVDGGDTLRAPSAVVMKSNIAKWADRGVEELLS
jgi:hypothetical protein